MTKRKVRSCWGIWGIAVVTASVIGAAPSWVQAKSKGEFEPRVIFVTSEFYDGNLGGLVGADSECQSLADSPQSVVPEGNYIALLSTSDRNASARPLPSLAPIVRPDGVPVAENLSALFSPMPVPGDFSESVLARELVNPVNVNERGEIIPDEPADFRYVQTGSHESGLFVNLPNCSDWTSNSSTDLISFRGDAHRKDHLWFTSTLLVANLSNCATLRRLYCIQQ